MRTLIFSALLALATHFAHGAQVQAATVVPPAAVVQASLSVQQQVMDRAPAQGQPQRATVLPAAPAEAADQEDGPPATAMLAAALALMAAIAMRRWGAAQQ